jgi:hypothetical protein
MSKNYCIFTFCILFLLAVSLSAQDVNVTGDWEMTINTPRGERTRDIHFEQEGEKLTVTWKGMRGREITAEGAVKGNEIEWTASRSTPRGEFKMTYTGKIEGDTMSGEVHMGDFGTREWKAKKK